MSFQIYFRNQKGSVLAITLLFVLFFTILGFSAIEFAGRQNLVQEQLRQSMEALWWADGYVEIARQKLPGVFYKNPDHPNPTSVVVNPERSYTYLVNTIPDPCCFDRWIVTSQATVQGQSRTIEAEIGQYDIDKILRTNGPIKDFEKCPQGSITIDCTNVEPNAIFTFESVFNGLTEQQVKALASYVYNDPNPGDITIIQNITVVNLINKNQVQIPADKLVGSGFLIIDATQSNAAQAQVDIEGGVFSGIIWIKGDVKITGNPNISGALFVQGSPTDETTLTGNGTLTFDRNAINDAADHIGTILTSRPPSIVSWKEL